MCCQVNVPLRDMSVREEHCASDSVHAHLLQQRVELHNGVWIVDDNIRLHDKVSVKLSVTYQYNVSSSTLCSIIQLDLNRCLSG